MKKLQNGLKKVSVVASNAWLSLNTFIASNTAVGQGVENASKNLLDELEAIYCGSLAWLLFAVNLVWLCLTKNEKVMAVLKKTLIGIIVAYIAIKILAKGNNNSLDRTVNSITNWISK